MGPLSPRVKHAEDFDGVCVDSIGNDVRLIADDQFASSRNSAWPPHCRILTQQINGAKNPLHDAVRRCRVVLRDAVRFCFEVGRRYA
jgi:hypothetical protein